jgi:hypothetical protein
MASSFVDRDIRATLMEMQAELRDLQQAESRVHAVMLALRQRSDDLTARISALEHRLLTRSLTPRTARSRHDA